MAITKNPVEMMGGAIAVRSAPGEGSEFTVWLPACFADQVADRGAMASEALSPKIMIKTVATYALYGCEEGRRRMGGNQD